MITHMQFIPASTGVPAVVWREKHARELLLLFLEIHDLLYALSADSACTHAKQKKSLRSGLGAGCGGSLSLTSSNESRM